MNRSCCIETLVGPLTVVADEQAVRAIRFGAGSDAPAAMPASPEPLPAVLRQAVQELTEYFAGERQTFTVPVAPAGTPFQQRVWQALRQIPYGATCSYRAIAEAIGAPKACRAVGMANHRNPIPILIPCHRVVGADGRLTGYASGLELKAALLRIERDGCCGGFGACPEQR